MKQKLNHRSIIWNFQHELRIWWQSNMLNHILKWLLHGNKHEHRISKIIFSKPNKKQITGRGCRNNSLVEFNILEWNRNLVESHFGDIKGISCLINVLQNLKQLPKEVIMWFLSRLRNPNIIFHHKQTTINNHRKNSCYSRKCA